MTKQALIELRDNAANDGLAMYSFATEAGFDHETAQLICKNNEGSLDAAVAFLEAVLPEWTVNSLHQERFPDNGMKPTGEWRCLLFAALEDRFAHVDVIADTPARALLLATLDALIERDE